MFDNQFGRILIHTVFSLCYWFYRQIEFLMVVRKCYSIISVHTGNNFRSHFIYFLIVSPLHSFCHQFISDVGIYYRKVLFKTTQNFEMVPTGWQFDYICPLNISWKVAIDLDRIKYFWNLQDRMYRRGKPSWRISWRGGGQLSMKGIFHL